MKISIKQILRCYFSGMGMKSISASLIFVDNNTILIDQLIDLASAIAKKYSMKTVDIINGVVKNKIRYVWRFDNVVNYTPTSIEYVLIDTYGSNAGIMFQRLLSQFMHGLLESCISIETPYLSKEDVSAIILTSLDLLVKGVKSR